MGTVGSPGPGIRAIRLEVLDNTFNLAQAFNGCWASKGEQGVRWATAHPFCARVLLASSDAVFGKAIRAACATHGRHGRGQDHRQLGEELVLTLPV